MTIDIKQRAHELIEALPAHATWQDLLYALELEFRADVEAGLADAKASSSLPSVTVNPSFGSPACR